MFIRNNGSQLPFGNPTNPNSDRIMPEPDFKSSNFENFFLSL